MGSHGVCREDYAHILRLLCPLDYTPNISKVSVTTTEDYPF